MRTRSWPLVAVLFDEVELLDVAGPLEVFSTAGRQWNWRPFKVHTAARTPGRIATRGQMAVVAEHSFETCPAAELLLVPGGYGARRALADAATLAFVRKAGAAAERIFAIGNGALLLAKAGLTGGAKLGLPREAFETLAALDSSAQASSEAELVESGKILSTAASGQALRLALTAVSEILGAKQAAQVASVLGLELEAAETTIDVV